MAVWDVRYSERKLVLATGEKLDARGDEAPKGGNLREGLYKLDVNSGPITPVGLSMGRTSILLRQATSGVSTSSVELKPQFHGGPYSTGNHRAWLHTQATPMSAHGIVISERSMNRLKLLASQRRVKELTLKVDYANKAPWMKTAWQELKSGIKEVPGSAANKRIVEDYFKASEFWGTDDSGGANAWCGSFVAYVVKQSGHLPPKDAFRAKEWHNFGTSVSTPTYGAICVKSRKGGGHVGFAAGQNANKDKIYLLGGNQSDSINIREYSASEFSGFYLPNSYANRLDWLPVYSGVSQVGGSET